MTVVVAVGVTVVVAPVVGFGEGVTVPVGFTVGFTLGVAV